MLNRAQLKRLDLLIPLHRCLQIFEVLSIIGEFIAEDRFVRSVISRWTNDLLSLALTCRTFLNPALNELWRRQSSLAPLLRCFPSDVYEFGETFEVRKPQS